MNSNQSVPLCARGPQARNIFVASGDRDADLAAIAELQHNRVATRQMHAIGWSAQMIRTGVSRQALHAVHFAVYAVGHAGEVGRSREAAALLAVPEGARLTGLSALAVDGLVDPDPGRPVELVLPDGRKGRPRPGITIHRSVGASAERVRWTCGLPATTVERAILDAAPALSERERERIVDESLAMRLTSRTKIRELVQAHGMKRAGAASLLALVDPARPGGATRKEAAALALRLIREAGIPDPEREVELFGYEADNYWREAGVVLEVDSFAWHGVVRKNFQRDRTKDRVYRRNGLVVLRVTADDLQLRSLQAMTDLGMTIAGRLARRAA